MSHVKGNLVFRGSKQSKKLNPIRDSSFSCVRQSIMYEKAAFCRIVLTDMSFTVKAATLIFISGRGLAISSAREW